MQGLWLGNMGALLWGGMFQRFARGWRQFSTLYPVCDSQESGVPTPVWQGGLRALGRTVTDYAVSVLKGPDDPTREGLLEQISIPVEGGDRTHDRGICAVIIGRARGGG